jgi:hypothetical protein
VGLPPGVQPDPAAHAEAALQARMLPRQLSFKHTLQIWIAWSQRQFLSDAKEDVQNTFRRLIKL